MPSSGGNELLCTCFLKRHAGIAPLKQSCKQGDGNILVLADLEFFIDVKSLKSYLNPGDFRNKLRTLQLHSSLQTTSYKIGSSFKTTQFKKAKIATSETILPVLNP